MRTTGKNPFVFFSFPCDSYKSYGTCGAFDDFHKFHTITTPTGLRSARQLTWWRWSRPIERLRMWNYYLVRFHEWNQDRREPYQSIALPFKDADTFACRIIIAVTRFGPVRYRSSWHTHPSSRQRYIDTRSIHTSSEISSSYRVYGNLAWQVVFARSSSGTTRFSVRPTLKKYISESSRNRTDSS